MDERERLALIVAECDRVLAALPADDLQLARIRQAVETTRRVALERADMLPDQPGHAGT